MKFKVWFQVYTPIFKSATTKALKNACYSALIAFISSLLAQLQNTQQITNITIITAVLTGTLTFLINFRDGTKFLKLIHKI